MAAGKGSKRKGCQFAKEEGVENTLRLRAAYSSAGGGKAALPWLFPPAVTVTYCRGFLELYRL